MNGKEILQIAHQMAGLSSLAEDSAVVLDASGIKRVAAGIDVATAELMLAKEAGADMVIAHHPTFSPGCLDGYRSLKILLDRMVELGVPPGPRRQGNPHDSGQDPAGKAGKLQQL